MVGWVWLVGLVRFGLVLLKRDQTDRHFFDGWKGMGRGKTRAANDLYGSYLAQSCCVIAENAICRYYFPWISSDLWLDTLTVTTKKLNCCHLDENEQSVFIMGPGNPFVPQLEHGRGVGSRTVLVRVFFASVCDRITTAQVVTLRLRVLVLIEKVYGENAGERASTAERR